MEYYLAAVGTLNLIGILMILGRLKPIKEEEKKKTDIELELQSPIQPRRF